MQDFDSLKNMWQQSSTENGDKPLTSQNTAKHTAGLKMKLQKEQLMGAIMLVITAILISLMALYGNFNFVHWYTYGAMVLVCIICLMQAAILLATYKKIKHIDETALPAIHLQQWEMYYAFRKKQIRWNMPVYYILLNIAMGIYFIEVLGGRPVFNVMILLAIYFGWMLFAWFYLGRKKMKQENARLQKIMDELKAIEGQLSVVE
jgi:MFS family permease